MANPAPIKEYIIRSSSLSPNHVPAIAPPAAPNKGLVVSYTNLRMTPSSQSILLPTFAMALISLSALAVTSLTKLGALLLNNLLASFVSFALSIANFSKAFLVVGRPNSFNFSGPNFNFLALCALVFIPSFLLASTTRMAAATLVCKSASKSNETKRSVKSPYALSPSSFITLATVGVISTSGSSTILVAAVASSVSSTKFFFLNFLAIISEPKAVPPPSTVARITLVGSTEPYKVFSLRATSPAATPAPAAVVAIFPALAILVHGINHVTGSAKACAILPDIIAASSGLFLNSGYSSNISFCLSASDCFKASSKFKSLDIAARIPATPLCQRFPNIVCSCSKP